MIRNASTILILASIALAAPALVAQASTAQTQSTSSAKATTAWVLGIASFSSPDEAASQILDTIPRLVVSRLKVLPTRQTPAADTAEAASLTELRARFTAGADLAAKLDARASSFLDPAMDPNARKSGIDAADKLVAASAEKLSAATAEDPGKAGLAPAVAPAIRETKLWDGYAKGQLIAAPAEGLAERAKAAKSASVDLLATGVVTLSSGYAKVVFSGYDSALDREVFSWKFFCSLDDPDPVASEIADRLERWVAGRDFARLELALQPTQAELLVEGKAVMGNPRVAYAYDARPLRIEASAPGFETLESSVTLELGERRNLELSLRVLSTGQVALDVDPIDSSVSLDSMPMGKAPLTIPLDGNRAIVSVSAPGRETQNRVLPASGDSSISIKLDPSDGLGPSGRISAAKDRFFSSFGLFMVSIPFSTLSASVYNIYTDSYYRSASEGMYNARNVSIGVMAAALATTGVTLCLAGLRLVKYLKVARQ